MAFAPSLTETQDGVTGRKLNRSGTCEKCHEQIAQEWSESIHSFASLRNPIYARSLQRFRKVKGNKQSQFCGGCHDLPLLVDNALERPLDMTDDRGSAGVPCQVCHGSSARHDGNGSLSLTTGMSLPRDNDQASIEKHKTSMKTSGVELCASCHRSFLGPSLSAHGIIRGMDEFSAWQNSAFARNGAGRIDPGVPKQDCISCHMDKAPNPKDPAADNGLAMSHRFVGGHSWAAAMQGHSRQASAVANNLKGKVSVDVPALRTQMGFVRPWDTPPNSAVSLSFDVTIYNHSVGHSFPGGVKDAQDTWLRGRVSDANGNVLATFGHQHINGSDPTAHILRADVADREGNILIDREVEQLAVAVSDHTVAPRSVRGARFMLANDKTFKWPLTIDVELVHRSRNKLIAKRCEDCAAQPITVIDKKTATFGAASISSFEPVYLHGLALVTSLQEDLEDAEETARAALSLARTLEETSQAQLLLGKVLARQGRVDDALVVFDQIEATFSEHPAVLLARAKALTRVWRWQKAEPYLTVAHAKAPKNRFIARLLADTRNSIGDAEGALAASQAGLHVYPRDSQLLRAQAQALDTIAPGSLQAKAAWQAAEDFRISDLENQVKMLCAQKSALCAKRRNPFPVYALGD